jgi:hypothetical protein
MYPVSSFVPSSYLTAADYARNSNAKAISSSMSALTLYFDKSLMTMLRCGTKNVDRVKGNDDFGPSVVPLWFL